MKMRYLALGIKECKKVICPTRFVALVTTVTFLVTPTIVFSGGPSGPPAKPSDAVSFKEIPGSKLKQVILKPKSAERLGIETGQVREETIRRRQMVGGRIVPPVTNQPKQTANLSGFEVAAQLANPPTSQEGAEPEKSTTTDETWVLVTLTRGEWDRLAQDKPVRLLPLATRDNFKNDLFAMPSGLEPIEDVKRMMLEVYYKIPDKDHGLALNERVRVELPLSEGIEKKKVVPYSAVYYDATGKAWVYVNPEPLVFERQNIAIDYIVDDLAVLAEGPAIGTSVVTTGSALLYGAEVVFKR